MFDKVRIKINNFFLKKTGTINILQCSIQCAWYFYCSCYTFAIVKISGTNKRSDCFMPNKLIQKKTSSVSLKTRDFYSQQTISNFLVDFFDYVLLS